MNSWEVRALWDESGCGNRTEKPVTRGTQDYREERGVQVTRCSTYRSTQAC